MRGWEMAVRTKKMTRAVLNEGHERQVEETMGTTLAEGLREFYRTSCWPRVWGFTPEPGLIVSVL